jgi:hypothetical protein
MSKPNWMTEQPGEATTDWRWHWPAVAPRADGSWGVFCSGCSTAANDYVYLCLIREPDGEWPPRRLVDGQDDLFGGAA